MTSTNQPPLAARQTYLTAAQQIISETRILITEAVEAGFGFELKADKSFVTEVDLAVEAHVRSRLHTLFPDHGIIGEEHDDVNPGAALTWVVDPIDGTHSFRHGVPLYGTLLALRHEDTSLLGVIDLPGLDRCYSGGLGLGVHVNDRALRLGDLGPDDDITYEILAIGERLQFLRSGRDALFHRLMHAHPSLRTYCDAFGHGLVLEGAVAAMVDVDLKIWDVSPTEALVAEAGGAFVCFDSHVPADGLTRYHVVFGKPRAVAWVMDLITNRASAR